MDEISNDNTLGCHFAFDAKSDFNNIKFQFFLPEMTIIFRFIISTNLAN